MGIVFFIIFFFFIIIRPIRCVISALQKYMICFFNDVYNYVKIVRKFIPVSYTHLTFLSVRKALAHSMMLSSDVSAGFDPLYKEVNDPKNAAYLGNGIVSVSYTHLDVYKRQNIYNT